MNKIYGKLAKNNIVNNAAVCILYFVGNDDGSIGDDPGIGG